MPPVESNQVKKDAIAIQKEKTEFCEVEDAVKLLQECRLKLVTHNPLTVYNILLLVMSYLKALYHLARITLDGRNFSWDKHFWLLNDPKIPILKLDVQLFERIILSIR